MEPTNKERRKTKKKLKMDMLRSISKQSRETMYSVLKKKRKATEGRTCRKGRFKIIISMNVSGITTV